MTTEIEFFLADIPKEERARFRNLIPENLRSKYSIATSRNPDDQVRYRMFASIEDNQPLGIALVKITKVFRLADIEHFYILPEKRNQGIGTTLLEFIEEKLRKENILVLQAIYPENEEWSPYATLGFAKLGYHPPFRLMLDLFFDVLTFRPDWMYYTKPLSKEWEFFLWKDLTEKEEEIVKFNARQMNFPSYLSPYRDNIPFNPETSVGLRHKNEVVGWNITHQVAPDTLKYAALYVRPEFHQKGQGVQLLIATLKAHDPLREVYPKAICEVRLDIATASWLKFLETKVYSHCQLVRYRLRVWKQLNETN